jgi:nitrilase
MLRVAAAQESPAFFNRQATFEKVLARIEEASAQGIDVLAFGETFVPGYPFWLSGHDGARFDDALQKELYRRYVESAVEWDGPELAQVCALAAARGIFVLLGVAERGPGPGRASIYCSAVPIHPELGLLAPHRKLMPTYEERLVWAQGDGHGLRVYPYKGTRLSVLNCWENWMPQARHALYALGTEVHFALWPGSVRNTEDCTRFVALEGRVFVISAGALLSAGDLPQDFPIHTLTGGTQEFQNGGSAIAGPDGRWIVPPKESTRGLIVADLDLREVTRERQNFDPTGHYSRPDVFEVKVDRSRRLAARFVDET